jgi:DNA-binding CsgD family transcriptional regulator
VDRTGYTAWGVHRLLPIIAEAQFFARDLTGARESLARLRRGAEALDHPLGLAWAETGEAIEAYLRGEVQDSIDMLGRAAERLDAIPNVFDAARVRRQLAGRLADLGDGEGSLAELRGVHDTLQRLGATRELEKARGQFVELGVRPPPRTGVPGRGVLTGREVEIARLVAEHKSNKSIGKVLGISPRTVSTHLSNIYGKLDVSSRIELAARAPLLLSAIEPPEG